MGLLDKLKGINEVDPDTDLLEFFGVGLDQFRWDRDRLTVGGETLPMGEVRAALFGGPIPQTPSPCRTVTIGDL